MQATSNSAVPTPLADSQAAFICPFCGLLCDDLPAPGTGSAQSWSGQLQGLCPPAAAGAAAAGAARAEARIDGQGVALEAALAEAGRRLAAARRPVVGGLGGDVQTARAALALADRCSARVLHRNQFAAQRNVFAYQGHGGITTTLAEARGRADLVLVVGGDVTAAFPRVLERIFAPAAFVEAGARHLLLLGAPTPRRVPAGVPCERVDAGTLDLFDAFAVLRAVLRQPGLPALAGVPAGLRTLAERMRAARYGVVLWAAPDLPAQGADLLVEQMHQLLVDLNKTTRWAALPLAGNEGDLSANAVSIWQTGFSLPIEFRAGSVGYDPYPDYGDADLLVWVDALPGVGAPSLPGAPPDLPAIVDGAGAASLALPPRHVVLPTAVPAIGSSGHLVRTDSVITLFAPARQASTQAPAAQVLERLAATLPAPAPIAAPAPASHS